jgi:hypothetical protein
MIAAKYPGIECDSNSDCDQFYGRAAALVSAGLVRADQLPGAPGMAPSSAAFVDGVRLPRHSRPAHDERWMQVTKVGNMVRVTKGIADEERARREQAEEEAAEARARIKPDPGREGAYAAVCSASVVFSAGDRVMVDDSPAVVSKSYAVHKVMSEDGEYRDDAGERFDYRLGYVIQYRNGESFFVPACDVTDPDGAPTHLRLVGGTSVRAQRPMMALRS